MLHFAEPPRWAPDVRIVLVDAQPNERDASVAAATLVGDARVKGRMLSAGCNLCEWGCGCEKGMLTAALVQMHASSPLQGCAGAAVARGIGAGLGPFSLEALDTAADNKGTHCG
eukprot:1141056-Pelagomonas_calceolata.AAC.6